MCLNMSMNYFTSYGRTKEIFNYFTVVVYYALVTRYTCKQSCGFSMASRFDSVFVVLWYLSILRYLLRIFFGIVMFNNIQRPPFHRPDLYGCTARIVK